MDLLEKFEPDTIVEYACSDDFRQWIQNFIKNPTDIVLHGTAGIGKTTLVKLLSREISDTVMWINASQERNIDTVRDKITQFGRMANFGIKVIILDEVDNMTTDAYKALRGAMDSAVNTLFLGTANYLNNIPEPVTSRMKPFVLPEIDQKDMYKFVSNLLDSESLTFDPKEIASVIKMYHPDFRGVIKAINLCIQDDKVVIDIDKIIEKDIKLHILRHVKNNDIEGIRVLLKEESITNYADIYKMLFDSMHYLFKDPGLGEVQILIAEHLYKHAFVPIPEINLAACLLGIMRKV